MNFRFTLTSDDLGSQQVDEPIGWDDLEYTIKRDPTWHGIFFEYGDSLKFNGENDGFGFIKAMYELYGIEAKVTLLVEWRCDEEAEFEELDIFDLNFAKVDFEEGVDGCFATIGIEQGDCLMQFKNRIDQAVDLEAIKSFDGTTDLTPYDKLPFEITMPSKTILKHDNFVRAEDADANFFSGTVNSPGAIIESKFKLGEDNPVLTEVGTDINDTFVNSASSGFTPTNDYNDIPLTILCDEDGQYKIDVKLSFNLHITGSIGFDSMSAHLVTMVGITHFPSVKVDDYHIITDDTADIPIVHAEPIDYTITYINAALSITLDLKKGDEIRFFAVCVTSALTEETLLSFHHTFTMQTDADPTNPDSGTTHNYFKLELQSKAAPSQGKVFMVNEALSRVAESITDDCLRVYSDYFGRTDAQPYSSPEHGCGALESITTGLFIRQFPTVVDPGTGVKKPLMSISFQDLFNGLNAIHNIGFGLEDDPNRPGNRLIRVEPMKYFYNNSVILTLDKIANIKRSVVEAEHYAIAEFGYQKWEAEQFSGLDEFNTSRAYRTNLTNTQNKLSYICSLIASGYAIEITRRLPYTDASSQDWRYDNDTFIICLQNQISIECDSAGTGLTIHGTAVPLPSVGDKILLFDSDNGQNGTYTVAGVTTVMGNIQITFTSTVGGGLSINAHCKYSNLTHPVYTVEQGNITGSDLSLVDPDTVINFRISPARNALRFMKVWMKSYIDPSNVKSQLIFVSGTANYTAYGNIDNGCEEESNSGVLSECQNLALTDIYDSDEGVPVYFPEEFELDYPMTVKDYKAVKANPRGIVQIRWGNKIDFVPCFIRSIKYKPVTGMATYTLLPKISFVDIQAILEDGTLEFREDDGIALNEIIKIVH